MHVLQLTKRCQSQSRQQAVVPQNHGEDIRLENFISEFKNEWWSAFSEGLGGFSKARKVRVQAEKITNLLQQMRGAQDTEGRLKSKVAMITRLHAIAIESLGAPPFWYGRLRPVQIDRLATKWLSIYRFVRDSKEDLVATE